jgi:hypothetical protein
VLPAEFDESFVRSAGIAANAFIGCSTMSPTRRGRRMTRTHHQTHQAGRHLAVAQALLRGYPASLGGRKLSTIEVNGHTAQVQVAGKGAWIIENVETYVAGTIEIVILVEVSKERPESTWRR